MTDPAQALLLFGATGDLAMRMLLPSLFGLHGDGHLPPDFRIIGIARTDLTDGGFQGQVADSLKRFFPADRLKTDEMASFMRRLQYQPLDIADDSAFDALHRRVGDIGRVAIFLSTSPALFSRAIHGLQRAGLAHDGVRLALEKPIGHDMATSRLINDAVEEAFSENRTYRIDHYLGKETVQNLLALRFGNRLFEPLWNAATIDHVQITVAETVGLEGRGGFYDGAGALRDMVQNHMLQLLALVAMEPPSQFDAVAVRDEKVKTLRALRPMNRMTVMDHSVLGQYAGGVIRNEAVPAYVDDLGAPSDTETFVALKAYIDNWRWKGVPFYLRTGKRLPVRRSEILVQFKPVSHAIFPECDDPLSANKLIIRLQPEEYIRLLMMVKEPGLYGGIKLQEVSLDLSLQTAFATARKYSAYERLLLDFINGDPTLFVRRDEVEAQWAWIDAIRDGWAHHGMTPELYAAGSWGPSSALKLTNRDEIKWHD